MKKIILLLILLLPFTVYAQEEEQIGINKQPTKYEALISKTGRQIKYVDIKHNKITTTNSSNIYTCIRKVYGKPNHYFYALSDNIKTFQSPLKEGSLAMIEYSDLVEVNKAIDKMNSEAQSDFETDPYNLVNEFCTVDHFTVGYRIGYKNNTEFSPGNYFYIQLEKYSGYYRLSSNEKMNEAFKSAQAMIEELMESEK